MLAALFRKFLRERRIEWGSHYCWDTPARGGHCSPHLSVLDSILVCLDSFVQSCFLWCTKGMKRRVPCLIGTFFSPPSGFQESVHGWAWFVAGLIFSDFRGACQRG